MPDVSAVLCHRKRPHLLPPVLRTVMEQDPAQVVFVNDAEPDGTEEIVREFIPNGHLAYADTGQPSYRKNPGPTWNQAVGMATQPFVVQQGSDVVLVGTNVYQALAERVTANRIILARVFCTKHGRLPGLLAVDLEGEEWTHGPFDTLPHWSPDRYDFDGYPATQVYTGHERQVPFIFLGAMHRDLWAKTNGYDDEHRGGADGRFARRVVLQGVGFIGLGDVIGIHLEHNRK